MQLNWIITDNNITVSLDNVSYIVKKDAASFKLIDALKSNNVSEIKKLVSISKRIEDYSDRNFIVDNGKIIINGNPVSAVLSNKIIRFADKNLSYMPLLNFANKLQKNPSERSIDELFQFLEKNDHPITESGNFLAYKKVRSDFKDCHTGTFDNSVGKVVEIARDKVDPDSNRTCSHGLHVANYDYAVNFYGGGIMLAVEVDPADVVAVPSDYNQAKMRVCKYKVVKVVEHRHEIGTDLISDIDFSSLDNFQKFEDIDYDYYDYYDY